MISKPTKPTKPSKPFRSVKPSSGLGGQLFFLASAGAFVASLATVALIAVLYWGAHRRIEFAHQAAANTVSATVEIAGKYFTVAVTQTLHNGTDEQRIEILTELAKVDLSTSMAPQEIIEGIKLNLNHDNESVRSAAQNAMNSLQGSDHLSLIKSEFH